MAALFIFFALVLYVTCFSVNLSLKWRSAVDRAWFLVCLRLLLLTTQTLLLLFLHERLRRGEVVQVSDS